LNLLITGATGIAAATAELAKARGHRVFLTGLEETADHPADLRNEAAAREAVDAAFGALGTVDGLFNVAGRSGRAWGDGPVHECSSDGFQNTLAANLLPCFHMMHWVIRRWLAGRFGGAVLNMGSVLASSPEPEHFATHAYAASKGAIEALSCAAAAYYARHGIRVNVIAPGLVRTPMSRRAQSDESIMDLVRRKQPLTGGILSAEEVAQAALFLLGEESRPITGQVLVVDGGWSVS
jgi:NAD(P)-dependent dehydrogenase (short-subunit alcohol dehydrogenase family)